MGSPNNGGFEGYQIVNRECHSIDGEYLKLNLHLREPKQGIIVKIWRKLDMELFLI